MNRDGSLIWLQPILIGTASALSVRYSWVQLTGLQPVCRLCTTADQSFRTLQTMEGSLLLLFLNGDSVIGALCLVSFLRYWVM